MAKRDGRIMYRADAYPGDDNRDGYVVDLSEGSVRNPDCFWPASTLRHTKRFLALVDGGMPAEQAYEAARA